MNKSWIIWSVLLILTGIFGLWGVSSYRNIGKQNIAEYSRQFSPENDEFLKLYVQWNNLSPTEKAQNPWGKGQYGGPEIQEKVRQQQQLRLSSHIADLASGAMEPHFFADLLYGQDWRAKVEEFKKQQQFLDSLQTAAIACTASGGVILSGYLCIRIILAAAARVKKKKSSGKSVQPKTKTGGVKETAPPETKPQNSPKPQPKKSLFEKTKPTTNQENHDNKQPAGYFNNYQNGAALDSLGFKETLRSQASEIISADPASQNEECDSQVATLMSTLPITENLSELAQEMSAIREFAVQQQDRVRQLQDGYDWSIIKRFCLRVIRCIDNIDDRIRQLCQEHITDHLEDIRDELVFALESSGVEQFVPEINSPYKGFEKQLEAVKERTQAPEPALSGMIAEVVRPGYHYAVSDQDVKIVRCAQVKLYD